MAAPVGDRHPVRKRSPRHKPGGTLSSTRSRTRFCGMRVLATATSSEPTSFYMSQRNSCPLDTRPFASIGCAASRRADTPVSGCADRMTDRDSLVLERVGRGMPMKSISGQRVRSSVEDIAWPRTTEPSLEACTICIYYEENQNINSLR